MKMTELQKYWYVNNLMYYVIENGMSSAMSYGDIVEGRKIGDGLLVFSVNGNQVYGQVVLPLEFFKEVDFDAAFLKGEDYDMEKD